ncbi:hypothetical protein U1Q18_040148 [Sarracenia purpurea var. burkii]
MAHGFPLLVEKVLSYGAKVFAIDDSSYYLIRVAKQTLIPTKPKFWCLEHASGASLISAVGWGWTLIERCSSMVCCQVHAAKQALLPQSSQEYAVKSVNHAVLGHLQRMRSALLFAVMRPLDLAAHVGID